MRIACYAFVLAGDRKRIVRAEAPTISRSKSCTSDEIRLGRTLNVRVRTSKTRVGDHSLTVV